MKLLVLALLMCLQLAFAGEAQPLSAEPEVERRLAVISEELRCLVCQNESLAGSRADLALDLRRELRELIRQGQSDAQIKAFMVQRYGDFILYRPPLKATTWLLWVGPFVALALGLFALTWHVRRRRQEAPPQALSAQEQARVQAHVKALLEGRRDD